MIEFLEGFAEWLESLNQNLVTIVTIIGSLTLLAGLQYKVVKKEMDMIFVQLAKNFLIRTLSKVEEGHKLSEIEMQGFKDVYGQYIKRGGNTYVKERYEKDKALGLL